MTMTLREIAAAVGGTVEGNPETLVQGATGVDDATDGAIIFVDQPRYAAAAASGPAAAVIAPPGLPLEGKPILRVAEPRQAFARVLRLFQRPERIAPGVAETARLGSDVTLGDGVCVGDFCSIGDGVTLGDGVILFPFVCIGDHVSIGAGSVLYPQVTVYRDVEIGARVRIHANSVIGADGFGYLPQPGGHLKIPHLGRVVIEDDVELGACVCVDRAKTAETRIGRGTKIDNLVQIAHNVRLGEHCLIAAQTGLAGTVTAGDYVVLGGQVGVSPHTNIGAGTQVAAQAGVHGATAPNAVLSGYPARDHREQLRLYAATLRLPDIAQTVRDLKKRVAELEQALQRSDETA
jgi:UDP-3-O-[3-hydroxymyristoyl] glucosamine N-acyltransferase